MSVTDFEGVALLLEFANAETEAADTKPTILHAHEQGLTQEANAGLSSINERPGRKLKRKRGFSRSDADLSVQSGPTEATSQKARRPENIQVKNSF